MTMGPERGKAVDAMGFAFDPHSPEFQAERASTYRRLRDEFPVYHHPVHDFYLVTRYDDVLSVLRDAETFSSAGIEEARALQPMMIYMDGEAHTRLRNLVSRAFTPRRVAELEPRVRAIARRLLDGIGDAPECELMHQFAAQLPSLVIGELIGIPEERRAAFLAYTESMIESGPQGHSVAKAARAIDREFADLLRARRAERRDDLMSALLDAEIDGRGLSEEALLGFCFLMVVGGNDTTMNLIGNGAVLLAENPDVRRRLVDDPGAIPDAIEEMLRLESPTQMLARRPVREVRLHGVTIPAESRLVVSFGAANLDERAFPEPERFDPDRANKHHLALGQGAHFCMGASLARMEGRIAFEELLARHPDYQLAEPTSWIPSRWARSHPSVRLRLRA
ncbi:MAG: cytochrome P450 [Myxococcota bacterium]